MEKISEIYQSLSNFFYTNIGILIVIIFGTIMFLFIYKTLIKVSRKLKQPITTFQKIGLNGLFFGNLGGSVATWINLFGLEKVEFTVFGVNLSIFEIFTIITFAYTVRLLNKRLKLI